MNQRLPFATIGAVQDGTIPAAIDPVRLAPAPWIAEFGEVVCVLDRDYGQVCTINWLRGPHGSFGRRPADEGVANALLLAAAPDLLTALINLLRACESIGVFKNGVEHQGMDEGEVIVGGYMDAARAAIAKATGAQP